MTGEKPLVSVVVMAFNQEQFVREAILGVLAQTYSPMEVILSDDASTDRTFEIMGELVDAYSGPHKVILKRSVSNKGLVNHINRMIEASSGEMLVFAAGDDISVPSRVETIVDAWIANGRPEAVCSGVTLIDESGQPLRSKEWCDHWFACFSEHSDWPLEDKLISLVDQDAPSLCGCSEALSREFCEAFPPLSDVVVFDDKAKSFRLWLVGGILYIPDALVGYRSHSSNICNRTTTDGTTWRDVLSDERSESLTLQRRLTMYEQYASDLEWYRDKQARSTGDELDRVALAIEAQAAPLRIQADWWLMSLRGRIAGLARLSKMQSLHDVRRWVPRLAPLAWFSYAKWLRRRIRQRRLARASRRSHSGSQRV